LEDAVKVLEIDDTTTAVQWTREARDTWQAMGERVGALVRHYGEGSEQARAAAMSYVQVATNLVGWGDVRVMRDSAPLSLFCSSPRIAFGIIWHESQRRCVNAGCDAYIGSDGRPFWYGVPAGPGEELVRKDCGDHTPDVPLDAPMPGTWSFHS
jgi:hypothetical protein